MIIAFRRCRAHETCQGAEEGAIVCYILFDDLKIGIDIEIDPTARVRSKPHWYRSYPGAVERAFRNYQSEKTARPIRYGQCLLL